MDQSAGIAFPDGAKQFCPLVVLMYLSLKATVQELRPRPFLLTIMLVSKRSCCRPDGQVRRLSRNTTTSHLSLVSTLARQFLIHIVQNNFFRCTVLLICFGEHVHVTFTTMHVIHAVSVVFYCLDSSSRIMFV